MSIYASVVPYVWRNLARRPTRTLLTVAGIADHRAPDDEAHAGRQALHGPEQQQRAHVGSQRTAHRGQQEHDQFGSITLSTAL